MPVSAARMTGNGRHRTHSGGCGFTLIEVLVALFVLAVGMLALAALQGRSLRDSTTAQLRGTALMLAYDISDRMRANPTGVTASTALPCPTSNHYQRCAPDVIPAQSAPTTRCTTPGPSFTTSTCTPEQMADEDMYQWLSALRDGRNGLPDPRATIIQDTGGTVWTITIYWNQDRVTSGAVADYQNLTLRYQP